jgi:hypothetical protein
MHIDSSPQHTFRFHAVSQPSLILVSHCDGQAKTMLEHLASGAILSLLTGIYMVE